MSTTTTSSSPRFRRTPAVPQMEEQDCGAACLVSVLAAFGRHVSLHEANRACGVTRDGVTASGLIRAAGSYGLKSHAKRVLRDDRLPMGGLTGVSVPSVVLVQGPHFAVFEGIRRGKVRVNDPSLGRYAMGADTFWRTFASVAITFEPGPDFRRGGRRWPLVRDLAGRVRPYLGPIAGAVLLAVLVSAPGVAASLLVRAAATNSAVRGDRITLFAIAAGICAVTSVVGTWLQQLVLARVLASMSARSSTRFLWRLLRLPGVFFHRRALGGLVTRVQLNDGMAVLLSGRVAAAAVSAISGVLYLLTLVWLDPTLAPIAVGVAAGQLALVALVARRRSARLHAMHTAEARRDAVAFAGVAAIETVKAEGSEDVLFRDWAGRQARVLNLGQEVASSTVGLFTLSSALNTAGSGLAIVLGMHQLFTGDVTFPTLLAFLMLMNGFLLPVGSLVGIGSELLMAKAQAALLKDIEDAEPDRFLQPVLGEGDGIERRRLRGGLALRQLRFGYDPARTPLFDALSLDVRPGEWVAVVGASGSGKSTLARLAAGVLRPWSGDVLLDGRARDELAREVVTSSVAYVEQRPRLFEGSARENLALWSATLGDDTLWRALADAEADGLVRARGGLDGAKIDEDARNFSGGERQRLEIARALAGDPTVLVLDEATSALDADTEVRVNENLRRRGCTCLVFAHRLSTVRSADRVLVIAAGKVAQEGTHDDLVAMPGAYQGLVGELS